MQCNALHDNEQLFVISLSARWQHLNRILVNICTYTLLRSLFPLLCNLSSLIWMSYCQILMHSFFNILLEHILRTFRVRLTGICSSFSLSLLWVHSGAHMFCRQLLIHPFRSQPLNSSLLLASPMTSTCYSTFALYSSAPLKDCKLLNYINSTISVVLDNTNLQRIC